ncbi:hypothetical protein ACSBR1_032586 [Camellia fascicularis]
MAMPEDEKDRIIQRLCTNVMAGDWKKVGEIYEKNPDQRVQGAAITISGDTALHMAVYADDVETVERLIKALGVGVNLVDDKWNTPLHHAAKIGNEEMCMCIAGLKHDLLARRNKDGETPFLVAALHGHEEVFNIFRIICFSRGDWGKFLIHCRRNSDGRTPLHCCIDGEYYEFAYKLLCRYYQFLDYIDAHGDSPLHLLARKYSAFKSSSSLTWWENFLYHCIPAEKPKMEESSRYRKLALAQSGVQGKENYTDRSSTTYSTGSDPENPRVRFSKNSWRAPRRLLRILVNSFLILVNSGVKLMNNLFPKHLVVMKQNHKWSVQIKDLMVGIAAKKNYRYTTDGCSRNRVFSNLQNQEYLSVFEIIEETSLSNENKQSDSSQGYGRYQETPILIAATNGISELVKSILDKFPVAIHDVNSEGKNLILLAVENRQPHVFEMLQHKKNFMKILANCVDNKGNNTLHHAAMLKTHQTWVAPDAVLQMQWELKWYEYVKAAVPNHLSAYRNDEGKNPEDIFMETHSDLVKNDKEWLQKTSESCTLVATLIATVAFGTSASLPGDIKSRTITNSQEALMLKVFGIASLLALFFSLTATIMFLSILTSRHQPTNFRKGLPLKLQFGLAALFMSFPSMLTCFCAGHFFILKDVLHNVKASKIAEFLAVLVPVSVFAIAQFPLYFKLMLATIFKRVPERAFMLTNTIQDSRSRPREAMQPPEYWRVTSVKEQALVAGSPSPEIIGQLISSVPQNEFLDSMKTASSSFNASQFPA